MPQLRLRHLALLTALLVSAACASKSGTAASAATSSKIIPPERLRGGPPPEIREAVDLRIEVLIDADGQPDLRTLKVTGKGSGSHRGAIEDWVRTSVFKPAIQDGQPVAGLFHIGLKSTVQVRRM